MHASTLSGVWLVAAISEQREGPGWKKNRELI
jgi:hypothetical protein